ncbi:PDZ domain-containing protein [Streptomyces bungoensis]|uniref:PDZ domain-containing protein n=1 Tax=Streptomyces bungoensis TaxID=285568 RepID=UPI0033EE39D3
MEHTALRPKPMPGQERRENDPAGPGHDPAGPGHDALERAVGGARRPHAARRRGRRIRNLLLGTVIGTALVLCGVGLGTVGTTVIGTTRPAEPRRQAPPAGPSAGPGAAAPRPAEARTGPTLGVEAVDAEQAGALVVGVHVPGPGYTAGLVRGDVLLRFGTVRVDTAAGLARAVAHARPGTQVTLTVRHRGGGYQQLTVVPGVVT